MAYLRKDVSHGDDGTAYDRCAADDVWITCETPQSAE
jgi:hypothetical protein